MISMRFSLTAECVVGKDTVPDNYGSDGGASPEFGLRIGEFKVHDLILWVPIVLSIVIARENRFPQSTENRLQSWF